MAGMTFYQIFWYFFIYAFLGWCLEVCFCTIDTGKLVNRGFLNGPLCPIYGFGMLGILVALLPLKDNFWLLFFGSLLVTSAIELFGGFALKKLFHTSWWDYSDQPFNIGGYICLKFSLAWGIGGVAAVRVIHPLVEKLVAVVPRLAGYILMPIVAGLCLCDLVVTVMAVAKMNRDLGIISDVAHGLRTGSDALSKNLGENALAADEKLDAVKQEASEKITAVKHEATEKIDLAKAEWSQKKNLVNDRLLRAFPKMKSSTDNEALSALRTWYENAAQEKKAARAAKKAKKQ